MKATKRKSLFFLLTAVLLLAASNVHASYYQKTPKLHNTSLEKKGLIREIFAGSKSLGEQNDPNVGFYYLRARWYNPENGRFTSIDPYYGDPQAPMSLHRYLYANVNPISNIDPSGEITLTQVVFTGLIIATVSAIVTETFHILYKRKIQWKGWYAGITGGTKIAGGGGLIITLESEEVNGEIGRGIYLIAMIGFSWGLPGNASGGQVTVETPGVYGPNPWILGGLFSWGSLSLGWGLNYSITQFYMGLGKGFFDPGLTFGIDIGLDVMGGVSIPIYGK